MYTFPLILLLCFSVGVSLLGYVMWIWVALDILFVILYHHLFKRLCIPNAENDLVPISRPQNKYDRPHVTKKISYNNRNSICWSGPLLPGYAVKNLPSDIALKKDYHFSYSTKASVMGTIRSNGETLLMRTHKKGFHGRIKQISILFHWKRVLKN